MTLNDRDSNVTQGEANATNRSPEPDRPVVVAPQLDELDLDELGAAGIESIDELMVRYEVEPDGVSSEGDRGEARGSMDTDLPSPQGEASGEFPTPIEPEFEEDSDEAAIAAAEEQAETAAQLYLTGRRAFESGYYRQAIANLERSAALSVGTSPIGGEIKIWLVLAYHAYGNLEAALALCRKLTHHPHIPTRQQGRRLRAILEAPELAKRPEWFTKIPDLSQIEEREDEAKKGSSGTYKPRPIRPLKEPEIDPATINRRDNQFIWVAIAMTIAVLAYIARFG